jgi:hypothetical protein
MPALLGDVAHGDHEALHHPIAAPVPAAHLDQHPGAVGAAQAPAVGRGVRAAFTVVSNTQVTVIVPRGVRVGQFKVTTPGGTATCATAFYVR